MFGNTPAPTHVGPYQVLRELGRGGMGVVYAAHDPVTGRTVAVKQVLATGASGPALERFLREAEALARVRHKGVVGVHQLGRTEAGPYIVLELVEGEPLSALVARGPLEPALAARLVRDVADAISAVHGVGIIHRDLKPANVMLRPDGSPVLLDFGLARDIDAERLTKTGDVLGTVAYMAPEQADGQTRGLDERVDVYALGAVLFELLAGAPAHQGAGYDVIVKILTKEPPRLRDRSPQAPAALDAVCGLAMARVREQRYQSVRALRDDLDRFLGGKRTEAERRELAAAPRGRRRAILGGAAVVALGVSIGVAVAGRGTPVEVSDAAPVATDGRVRPTPAAPAVAPLWSVEEGEVLVYHIALHEFATNEITFDTTLELTSATASEGQVAFTCRVLRIRCGMPKLMTTFDSDVPVARDNPLASIGAAVGGEFSCAFDSRTGAVVAFAGFGAINARIVAETEPSNYALTGALQRVFQNDYLEISMHGLTHVDGGPWKESHGAAAGIRSYSAVGSSPGRMIESLNLDRDGPDSTFTFMGTAKYQGGRLLSSQLEQTLDGPGPRRAMLWSMKLDGAP